MDEYYLVDKVTGMPAGIIDADELKRHAARIALQCAEAVGSDQRILEILTSGLDEYPLDTRAFLLPLVVDTLLSGPIGQAFMVGLEVHPEALTALRRRAGE